MGYIRRGKCGQRVKTEKLRFRIRARGLVGCGEVSKCFVLLLFWFENTEFEGIVAVRNKGEGSGRGGRGWVVWDGGIGGAKWVDGGGEEVD